MMTEKITRRDMIRTTAVASAGLYLGTASSSRAEQSPNEKLNIACIGIGGRGRDNLNGVKSQNIVALCDVDESRGGKSFGQFPKAQRFVDYRKMLDELDKSIDAVVVSTPDHTHFHPSMLAMSMGKHLYCEKPMAHSVWEVREMTNMAAKMKVATQLGVQRHTLQNMHRSVEIVQAGLIGDVSEVHCWVGGDRGMPKVPNDKPEIPAGLNWDLWLGPASFRPYHKTYCPYGWRFWWDFGTGETGNWGCHILDIPYWALGLTYPNRAEGSGPPIHALTTPKSMTTMLHFPEQNVDLHWYHAKSGPPILKQLGMSPKGMNTLFIGSKGNLLTGFSKLKLYPEEKFADIKRPEKSIPNSPGFYNEWFASCKGGEMATCDFSYSGPLSETVLLANAAYRSGGGFDWDAKNLKSSGNDKAPQFLTSEFRKGWEV
ncbi:MAG: NADH-dependent dehydrogenase [Planctomycetaceae bacterium]|nr:NADH-dependent dehydrogenase [Planctomycetaceae bacterium]